MAGKRKKAKGRWRKRLGLFFLGLCLFGVSWLGLIGYLNLTTHSFSTSSALEIRPTTYGIVFGAGLRGDQPSTILKNRLDGAIDLYRLGKIKKLLMSGDNRFVDYNEPRVMRKYALAHAVPDTDIVMDYAGRDTYDTCYRARKLFGIDRAVLITQGFHMPRAIFLSRAMGIDATGYVVPNLRNFPGLKFGFSAREALADVKAVWDLEISHRLPYVDAHKRRDVVMK